MKIALSLGLKDEAFCRMVMTTKMLLSNVLGHAAELHYEKELISQGKTFEKAPTDVPYDYIVNGKKDQVKRFESGSTTKTKLSANLTKTHGDRSAEGGFYTRGDFDRLVLLDVGFANTYIIEEQEIPNNKKYPGCLPGKYVIERTLDSSLEFENDFLSAMRIKNSNFPSAVEELKEKYKMSYSELLARSCDLTLEEIDSLFCVDNFRLIVGAKGFAGEEHFNQFLEESGISYKQMKDMYSKHDHLVKDKIRVQVKTLHGRSTNTTHYGFKTHKSHGSGVGELLRKDDFDLLALFVGFEDDEENKYLPKSASSDFIFIPATDLQEHPKHPGYLKRVSKVLREKYPVNKLDLFL